MLSVYLLLMLWISRGVKRTGSSVTDDSCFFRFFGMAEAHKVSLGESGEEVVSVVGRNARER